VRGKKLLVNGHEPRLPYSRACLEFGKITWALFVSQRAHARADRARGDQHDFPACLAQLGELRHKLFKLGHVGLLAAVGQHTRAKFDNKAGGGFE